MDRNELKKRVLEEVDPKLRAERKKAERKIALITAAEFIGVIVVVIVFFFILMGTSTVDGDSMYPTLHDGDKVVFNRNTQEYKKNDIVAIKMDNGAVYVKRIIGVAGDTINVQSGKIYINGIEEKTPQAIGETRRTDGSSITYPYLVPESSYFVLGDNREISDDSRNFGAVTEEQLKGKIKFYIGKIQTVS